MARMVGTALAAVALALAACGGDDDEDSTRAPTGEEAAPDAAEVRTSGEDEDSTPGGDEADGGGEAGAGGAGQDDSEDARRPVPSRAEYISRADAICGNAQTAVGPHARAIQEAVQALQRGTLPPREYYRRTAARTTAVAAIARRALAELRGLARPRDRNAALERYMTGVAEQARLLALQARQQRSRDVKAVVATGRRLGPNTRRTRAAAREFGFTVCGGA